MVWKGGGLIIIQVVNSRTGQRVVEILCWLDYLLWQCSQVSSTNHVLLNKNENDFSYWPCCPHVGGPHFWTGCHSSPHHHLSLLVPVPCVEVMKTACCSTPGPLKLQTKSSLKSVQNTSAIHIWCLGHHLYLSSECQNKNTLFDRLVCCTKVDWGSICKDLGFKS